MDRNRHHDYQTQITRYKKEGLFIQEISEQSIIHDTIQKIQKYFSEPTEHYEKMTRNQFHDYVVQCQNEINTLNIQKRFYESEKHMIDLLLPGERVLQESVVFLRAVRPKREKNAAENPDFHRETFYSDDDHTPHVVNMWMPILNVTDDNTLQYIPESHLIPDDDIKTEEDENYPGRVDKYSSGHKLGFFWLPKKIISGVDLNNRKKMHFAPYTYSLFSSMLIHGAAVNNTDKIRFAIGFGMLPKSAVNKTLKNFFAADGNQHFVEM